ncbi:MAG TPA: hypothetical protein PKE31_03960 [Pseudomonadota bacterium]|nr:hypothetical protein [Pseudomonadota bacterium]
MALPNRLWLADGGQEPPTWIVEPRTSTGPAPTLTHTRWRRKAVLAGGEHQPERTMLVEWFPLSELLPHHLLPLRNVIHHNLLRFHECGPADPKTAYAMSDAPLGLDLATIVKTAGEKLPVWWGVAVLCEAARGLVALHDQLRQRGFPKGHGAVDASCIFVSPQGRVQVLCFAPLCKPSALHDPIAPEVRKSWRLATVASDVYSLCVLLKSLPLREPLPEALSSLSDRGISVHAEKRPTLLCIFRVLSAELLNLGAPLALSEHIGLELSRVLPAAKTGDATGSDWGNAGPATFGPLPKTLSPLAATAVSLSATWDTVLPNPPSPNKVRFPWATIAPLVCLCTLVCAWLAWAPFDATPSPLKQAAAHVRMLRPPPPPLPAILPVAIGASGQWRDLRVSILRKHDTEEEQRLLLLVINPTQTKQTLDPETVRLTTNSSPTEAPLSAQPQPLVELLAGQMQTVELRFHLPPGTTPSAPYVFQVSK